MSVLFGQLHLMQKKCHASSAEVIGLPDCSPGKEKGDVWSPPVRDGRSERPSKGRNKAIEVPSEVKASTRTELPALPSPKHQRNT